MKIMPDRLRTTLSWWKMLAFDLSSTGRAAVRFHGSGAFPDPTSTQIPAGYAELVAFYSSYRITASRCKIEYVNTSTDSVVQLVLLPTNLDPTASPSADYIVSSSLQPYAKTKMASTQGGPVTRINSSMTTQRIYGNKMTKFDDNFAATVSVNPVNMWFWVLTLYSLVSIPSDTPFLVRVNIDFDIEFYDRRFIVDTSTLTIKRPRTPSVPPKQPWETS